MKNKIRKLNKEKEIYLKNIYNNLFEDNRLNYVYALALLQNISFIVLRRKRVFSAEALERFLVNEYIPEQNKLYNQVDFGYMSIVKSYMSKKYPFVDFNKTLKIVLDKINYAEYKVNKKTFDSIENYFEHLLNEGLDRKQSDLVYHFVVKNA